LEALAAAQILPEASGDGKPPTRCPQGWKQWFELRMDQPINMLQPTSGQATATAMYSWVLTALNIMQVSGWTAEGTGFWPNSLVTGPRPLSAILF
jgi:hypothetical protein